MSPGDSRFQASGSTHNKHSTFAVALYKHLIMLSRARLAHAHAAPSIRDILWGENDVLRQLSDPKLHTNRCMDHAYDESVQRLNDVSTSHI